MADITFDETVAPFMLEALGCKTDKQGYITQNGNRIKSISNKPIQTLAWGGVIKGKNGKFIFISNNLTDLIALVKYEKSTAKEMSKKI